ncbi:MAG: hypothetical protein WDN75_09235 [Bacteroidota bacterium]
MIARWLLSFGSTVVVEQPLVLREILANLVEELHEHHIGSAIGQSL